MKIVRIIEGMNVAENLVLADTDLWKYAINKYCCPTLTSLHVMNNSDF